MEIAEIVHLKEKLQLFESSQKHSWIKWHGHGLVEVLDTSAPISELKKGMKYQLADVVHPIDVDQLEHHFDDTSTDISKTQFSLKNKGDSNSWFSCFSQKVGEDVFSLWILERKGMNSTTFFQIVAHDLRSPVNLIIGIVNLGKQLNIPDPTRVSLILFERNKRWAFDYGHQF